MNRLLLFFKRKVEFRIPVWFFITIPFIAYLAWEGYWYTKVGLGFIRWHTHAAVYIYVWIAVAVCFEWLCRSEKAKNRFLLFSSVLFALLLFEIYFHVSGDNKTQTEKDSGLYRSPYISADKTHHHLWPSILKEHWITKPEFSFWRPTNSAGLADREWPVDKKPEEIRIMALGDSFTEGDGAAYDSTYVFLLRQMLLSADSTYTVMNAGVCGSDPFNNYVVLRDCLLVYKPDIIVQVIGTNDMNTDIVVRGGMERFQKDGSVKYYSAPCWEPLYAINYVSRVFFSLAGYNELLVKDKLSTGEQEEINTKTVDLFKQYSALCLQNHIRLAVVLRPDKFEVINNKYSYNFSPFIEQIKADSTIRVVDLLPAYREYLKKRHADAMQYYWVIDGHHNSKGYEMMAQTIFESLSPMFSDTTVTR